MIKADRDAPGIENAVLDKTNALLSKLAGRLKQNLSGGIVEAGYDELSASILASTEGGDSRSTNLFSFSSSKAAAQKELTAKPEARSIAAAGAKHFAGTGDDAGESFGGGPRPSQAAPARVRRAGPPSERRNEIASSFKQAILEALGQG
ncbi:MAG: hypothetical protein L0Y57_07300 [Beijerinckiaceae bacterium]|nr:hypothetical protein [Beijerinckiaceae bacterium]